MIAPKRIDITPKQLEELLARAKESLPKEDYEIIKGMADTISFLSNAVNSKSASIQRLLAMLFGTITEKTAKVLREKKAIESDKKKKCRGHGKNGAVSYSGAEKIKIPHVFIPVRPDTYSGIYRTRILFFKGHLNYPNSYLSIYKK